MKISVLTPVFNGEKYISNAIESVLSQRGEFEIEYIVIDGASTDKTLDIVKDYYDKYLAGEYSSNCNNISFSYISEADQGMYDAICKGFARCSGDVLCWINADDYYLENCFGRVCSIFEERKEINWITGRCNVVDQYRKYLNRSVMRYYPSELIRKGGYGLQTDFFIPQESTFWRRELLKGIDLNFLASMKMAGDFYLWYCFAESETLYSVNEDFAVFRKTETNLSSDHNFYRAEMRIIIDKNYKFTYRDRIWLNGYDAVWRKDEEREKIKFPYLYRDNLTEGWELANTVRSKGESKKVSIITVCYNEPNIVYTCESIVNQTWNDYEWIVIDGGSEAETIDLIKRYEDRIDVLISEPDSGVYNAMNKGIRLAQGEWIIFMNGGDQFYNVKVLEKVFEDNKYSGQILYGDEDRIDQYGKRYVYRLPVEVPAYFMCYQSFAHQAMFYKKELFEKYGGYDESYLISADSEKNTQFLVQKVKFEKINIIVSAHQLDGISINQDYKKILRKEMKRRRLKYYPKRKVELYAYGARETQINLPLIKIKNYRNGNIKKYYLFGILLLFTAKRAF